MNSDTEPRQSGIELVGIADGCEHLAFFWMDDEPDGVTVDVRGDTAHVSIEGMTGYAAGQGRVIYSDLVARMRKIYHDPRIKRVKARITGPGGYMMGAFDAADELHALAATKPTDVYVPFYAQSCTYLLATAMAGPGKALHASPNAKLGSVDVKAMRPDVSEAMAKDGRKLHVFSGLRKKTWGTPQLAMTEEEAKSLQDGVNTASQAFRQKVTKYGYGSEQSWVEAAGSSVNPQVGVNCDKVRTDMGHEANTGSADSQTAGMGTQIDFQGAVDQAVSRALTAQREQMAAATDAAITAAVNRALAAERLNVAVTSYQASGFVANTPEGAESVRKALAASPDLFSHLNFKTPAGASGAGLAGGTGGTGAGHIRQPDPKNPANPPEQKAEKSAEEILAMDLPAADAFRLC